MSYVVVISKKCIESSTKYQLEQEVEDLKNEIESKQYIGFLDNFPSFFLKKRFKRQQRLIAQEQKVQLASGEEHSVILFFDIFIRGSKEYLAFISNTKEFAEKNFTRMFEEKELQRELETRLRGNEIGKLPIPDDNEYALLYSSNILTVGNEQNDIIIFESKEWVESIIKKDVRPYLSKIADQLRTIVEKKSVHVDNKKYDIIYNFFEEYNVLFLAGICEKSHVDIEKIKKKYSSFNTNISTTRAFKFKVQHPLLGC